MDHATRNIKTIPSKTISIYWAKVESVKYSDIGVSIKCYQNSVDCDKLPIEAMFKELAQLKEKTTQIENQFKDENNLLKEKMAQIEDQLKDVQDENNLLKDYVSLLNPVKSIDKK